MNLRLLKLMVLAAVALWCALLTAQTPKQAAEQWRAAHEQQILQEFTALLSIPNVASDTTNIQRNADMLVAALAERHVDAKLLTAAGSNPVVYGEIKTPGAKRTLVFYAHYDGQAVNPADWESGAPFTPTTKMVNGEPRIFARAASDDKAAILAQLTALDALQAAKIPFKANLRFVWEGEEEAGSTNLEAVLEKYNERTGRRRVADLRRPGGPERTPERGVRRARRDAHRRHALRTEPRAAQRTLWQLGAESGDDAGAVAGRHGGLRMATCWCRTSTTASRR